MIKPTLEFVGKWFLWCWVISDETRICINELQEILHYAIFCCCVIILWWISMSSGITYFILHVQFLFYIEKAKVRNEPFMIGSKSVRNRFGIELEISESALIGFKNSESDLNRFQSVVISIDIPWLNSYLVGLRLYSRRSLFST